MTKLDYLSELEGELRYLSKKDRTEYISHYRQRIDAELDSGLPEDKVIDRLPSPRAVALNIYREKGIDYLQKQKNKVKVASILFILFSLALMVAVSGIGVSVFLYFGQLIINMLFLYPEFIHFALTDMVISILFLTTYLLLSIIFMMIIFEVALYILRMLIYRLVDIFPHLKEIDLEPWSITYWINRLFRQQNIIPKAFGMLCLVLLGLGFLGYFNKTYIYRAMTGATSHEETFTLEPPEGALSIMYNVNEARVFLLQSEDDTFKIVYRHEFNHHFSYTIENSVLQIETSDTKNYDVFNLLKEPVPYVEIRVPANVDLNAVTFSIAYGETVIKDKTFNIYDVKMLSGKAAISGCNISDVSVIITKATFQSTKNQFEKVELSFGTGTFILSEDRASELSVTNTYANGTLTGLVIPDITITNDSGNIASGVVADEEGNLISAPLRCDRFVFDTAGGSLNLKDYEIKNLIYQGTGIGNISLKDGTSEMLKIDSSQGLIYMEALQGSISITGSDLNVSSINQISGTLEVHQVTGSITVVNDPESDNRLDLVKCEANDADLTISDSRIDELQVKLGRSIVLITDVYGDRVNIEVESGDLNYVNSDKTRHIAEFSAKIKLGSRNVDVG